MAVQMLQVRVLDKNLAPIAHAYVKVMDLVTDEVVLRGVTDAAGAIAGHRDIDGTPATLRVLTGAAGYKDAYGDIVNVTQIAGALVIGHQALILYPLPRRRPWLAN